MHAVCLDTYPPISYMTDISHDIQRLVHALNNCSEKIKVHYNVFDCSYVYCVTIADRLSKMTNWLVFHKQVVKSPF
jgi:diphosphomevalonate decarboxylase